MRQVQPRELVLARADGTGKLLDEPVVERPVVGELERADRVRDALDRVGLAVREVVRRVDAPRVARPRVRGVEDPVQDRVAQVDVARRHVDPRAQVARAVGELASTHPREEVEALLDGPVAPGARSARLGQRAAVLADLVGGQVVHVGLARAVHLIRAGKAYVDDLSADEIREHRGTLTEPGRPSPWRDRSVDESLDLFARMRAGELPDGARTLRARIYMASGEHQPA